MTYISIFGLVASNPLTRLGAQNLNKGTPTQVTGIDSTLVAHTSKRGPDFQGG